MKDFSKPSLVSSHGRTRRGDGPLSALFRKISWQQKIDRFDCLRAEARKCGLSLTVKNAGKRSVPMFMFNLNARGRKLVAYSHDLDEIEAKIGEFRK